MNWIDLKKGFKTLTFKQKVFTIFVVLPIVFIVIIPLAKVISEKIEEKRRYKKVIKKGWFWDTEYLIEK